MRWLLFAVLLLNMAYFAWLKQLEVAGEVGAVAEPVTDVKALRLLSEGEIKNTPVVAVLERDDSGCWLVGPFQDLVAANVIKERLLNLSLTIKFISQKVQVDKEYWVYIPPLPDRASAINLLRELQSKGVDSFVVSEGKYKHSISLGVFREKERADRVAAKRKEEGYKAVIQLKTKELNQYWALYNEKLNGPLTDELWQVVTMDNKKLKKQKKSCDGVALIN